jgi:biopolymer transport protein ExbD
MAATPQRGGVIEGINVTPLVDIMLVLLVVFMVAARVVSSPAVPLDLPQASRPEEVQTVLSVTLPAEGPARVDGQPVDAAALTERARQALARDPAVRAVISADRAVSHGRVMGVLDRLREAGLARVAFGAEAAPAGDAGSRTAPSASPVRTP